MKQNVTFSSYSIIISSLSLLLIAALFFYNLQTGRMWSAYLLLACIIAICITTLFYAPLSITVTEKELSVNRSLRVKNLALDEISGIALCQPTMGAMRICGSGGWFGYWGWFRERDLGKYFAYYGKASDCFLVTMKDGKKYMLGCNNPSAIVDYVASRIN